MKAAFKPISSFLVLIVVLINISTFVKADTDLSKFLSKEEIELLKSADQPLPILKSGPALLAKIPAYIADKQALAQAIKMREKGVGATEEQIAGMWMSEYHWPTVVGFTIPTYEFLTFYPAHQNLKQPLATVERSYWRWLDPRPFDFVISGELSQSIEGLQHPVRYQRGHWEIGVSGQVELSDITARHSLEAVYERDLMIHMDAHPDLNEIEGIWVVEGQTDKLVLDLGQNRMRSYKRIDLAQFNLAKDILVLTNNSTGELPCVLEGLQRYKNKTLNESEEMFMAQLLDFTLRRRQLDAIRSAVVDSRRFLYDENFQYSDATVEALRGFSKSTMLNWASENTQLSKQYSNFLLDFGTLRDQTFCQTFNRIR